VTERNLISDAYEANNLKCCVVLRFKSMQHIVGCKLIISLALYSNKRNELANWRNLRTTHSCSLRTGGLR